MVDLIQNLVEKHELKFWLRKKTRVRFQSDDVLSWHSTKSSIFEKKISLILGIVFRLNRPIYYIYQFTFMFHSLNGNQHSLIF